MSAHDHDDDGGIHACDRGVTFDTLDELTDHAKVNMPRVRGEIRGRGVKPNHQIEP